MRLEIKWSVPFIEGKNHKVGNFPGPVLCFGCWYKKGSWLERDPRDCCKARFHVGGEFCGVQGPLTPRPLIFLYSDAWANIKG